MLRGTSHGNLVLAAALVTGLAGSAHADDDVSRAEAEALAETGEWEACSDAYRRLYTADPAARDADELLFDAAVCGEKAGSIGHAITFWELLRKRFPRSELARQATTRVGDAYARIAWYRQAAAAYLDYARRYAGERDAADRLLAAFRYLQAVGDRAGAIRAGQLFVKQYARKRAGDAARVAFAIATMHPPDSAKRAAAMRAYLRRWSERGPRGLAVSAHVDLGAAQWRAACPGALTADGLCLGRPARAAAKPRANALPVRCGDALLVRPKKRRAGAARAARKELQAAVTLYDETPAGERDTAAERAHARALILLADADLEALLGMRFPGGLDFARAEKRSKERMMTWQKDVDEVAIALAKKYWTVAEMGAKAGPWAAAGAARAGRVQQHYTEMITNAELPADVRRGSHAKEKVDAYCRELRAIAEPLATTASRSFGHCLSRNPNDPWRTSCARGLGRVDPADTPALHERTGAAGAEAPVLDLAAPILAWPGMVRDPR